MGFKDLINKLKSYQYLTPSSERQSVIDDNLKMLMEKEQQGPKQEGEFSNILERASSKPYAIQDADRIENILNQTKMLETRGQTDPTNTLHKKVSGKVHNGERAFGSFGLMPETIRTIARRESRDDEMGPGFSGLENQDQQTIHDTLQNNEELQRYAAKKYIEDMLKRNPNLTDEEIQYKYEMGPSTTPSPKSLDKNKRIQRYRKLFPTK